MTYTRAWSIRRSRPTLATAALLLSVASLAVFTTPTTAGASSQASAIPSIAAPPTMWTTVVNDDFNTGGVPSHWVPYNGPYGSGVDHNCAAPSHNTVSGGYLHLKMFYEPSTTGKCGAAWYSGGLTLSRTMSSVSQRVTTRFRVVGTEGIQAHRIIPMRSPDDGTGVGEEDFCESTAITYCSTFLHWEDEIGRYRLKYFMDLGQWHTVVATRDGYHVTTTIDGVPKIDVTGDAFTLPPKLMHIVLQQECNKEGCPLTTTGMEDIQIDSILVENPTAPPPNIVTEVTPTVVNAANSTGSLAVGGISSGASSVSVTVTDGTTTTPAVTTTPMGPSGSQTWIVDVGSIDSLADGVLTANATYEVNGATVNGPGMTLVKDTQAPQVPQTSVAAGTYFTARTVSLTNPPDGGIVHFTIDGTVPSMSSPKYVLPLTVKTSQTVQAISIDAAGNSSPVTTASYVIGSGSALLAPDLVAASDTGTSSTDNVTSSNPLTYAGSALAGATVRLFFNAAQVGSVQADATGKYQFGSVVAAEGSWTATVSATDAAGQSTPLSKSTPVRIDRRSPVLTAAPAGGSYTSAQHVVLTASEPATITYSFLPSGGVPTPDATYTGPITLTGPGLLTAAALDTAGNTSSELDEAYTIVTNPPPVVVAPTATIGGNTTLSSTDQIRVSVVWSATDPDGIQSYELQKRVNGGTWTAIALSPLTTKSTQTLTPGATYQFQVRATDANGNVSAFAIGRAFALSLVQQNPSASVSYTGATWVNGASSAASGGSVSRATAAAHSVSVSFTGDSISWIAPRSPGAGTAQLSVDGAAPVTIDLYATASSDKNVVYKAALTSGGSHTLTINVLGAKRTASTGTVVTIDAFGVLDLI